MERVHRTQNYINESRHILFFSTLIYIVNLFITIKRKNKRTENDIFLYWSVSIQSHEGFKLFNWVKTIFFFFVKKGRNEFVSYENLEINS